MLLLLLIVDFAYPMVGRGVRGHEVVQTGITA
jgi:hypothetical protein